MKVHSHKLISAIDMPAQLSTSNPSVSLVFVHGPPLSLGDSGLLRQLKKSYPNAKLLGCSSAGEILNGKSYENSIVVSAIEFDHTKVRSARMEIKENTEEEYESGKTLAKQLLDDDLKIIILFSEGLAVDCDEVIKGMSAILSPQTHVFGGLAGDIDAFNQTLILDGEGVYDNGVVAVGLYGERLHVNTSTSLCTHNGQEIEITSAQDNIIYTINGQPALDIYVDLINQQGALDLSSRLSFPIAILDPKTREPLYLRTVHEYHNQSQSILLAGTIAEGPAKIVNMTNSQHILEDSDRTSARLKDCPAEFAFIVDCAGRRGTMGSEWVREGPIIKNNLGDIAQHGFYSFGEIGKGRYDNSIVLHNHTLNIASFYEA
ncbi:FIST C-terminal domain-containing protein [Arenicella sp.]|nr:FIST C-terminal domain-containing protein [Arenicella sp.]